MNGQKVISCYAPYGEGGLGRYIAQLVEESRSAGDLATYFAKQTKMSDDRGQVVDPKLLKWLFKIPPVRFSLGLKDHFGGDFFDRSVAKLLPKCAGIPGFNGKALHSFRCAQQLGYSRLLLESANSHAENIVRQHLKAHRRCPIEDTWLHKLQLQKSLREYEMADEIFVASTYSWNSFVEAGINASKLRMRRFTVDEKYRSVIHRSQKDDLFRIVFVGRVDITKGVDVLRTAFENLGIPHSELRLLGGTSSRGMQTYMKEWMTRDSRVHLAYGDPLPYLTTADVLVHPSYEDGFALSPLEALCCSVPVIVTDHTGMKDYVEPGKNGYVIPADDADALVDRLRCLHREPLVNRFSPPKDVFL